MDLYFLCKKRRVGHSTEGVYDALVAWVYAGVHGSDAQVDSGWWVTRDRIHVGIDSRFLAGVAGSNRPAADTWHGLQLSYRHYPRAMETCSNLMAKFGQISSIVPLWE